MIPVQETETVTRNVARWGSLAAAFIFGVAFAMDERKAWPLFSDQVVQVGLIALLFAGYALAWTRRYETLGSVIALAGTVVAYVFCGVSCEVFPSPLFLGVGAPALFHLLAVFLHHGTPRRAGV